MGVVLEIKSGPFARKSLNVVSGNTVLIGRAPDRAQFAVPHDTHMSGVHFAVECGPSGCRVIDKKSTNGTFLNGSRIQEAMLASGDEIKSGQTAFVVRIVPDDQLPAAPSIAADATPPYRAQLREVAAQAAAPAPLPRPAAAAPASPAPGLRPKLPEQPAASAGNLGSYAPRPAPPQPSASPSSQSGRSPALAIGNWTFLRIPDGWQVQEGLGIQLDVKDEKAFSSNIGAMEEPLGAGITLSEYVESQTKMFREYLREPKIEAALPPKIPGASETIALEVRFGTKDGPALYYRRVYARSHSSIGVLTLTTLEKDLSAIRPAYDSFLSGASFSKPA